MPRAFLPTAFYPLFPMSNTIQLQECLDLFESSGGPRVDRDAGVIRGVKLLGWSSANGREYLAEGVDPSMYEGRPVNVNHVRSGQDRSAYDRFGRTVNCVKRANGIYGDLEYLKTHPLAGPVTEAAERMPGVYGLSHTARGRQRAGSRGAVIEAVESVQSVDLVGDPATVAGLYESRTFPVTKKISDLIESLKKTRPGYARALREAVESGVMSSTYGMDEPAAPEGDATPDEDTDHQQAIFDACKAVIDDPELDKDAKLDKLKKLLGVAHDEPDGDEGGEGEGDMDGSEGSSDDEAREESRKMKKTEKDLQEARKENARLKAREMIRNLADEANVKLPKTLLEHLDPHITEAGAKKLIAELKGSTGSVRQQPRSGSPLPRQTGKGKAGTSTVTESREEKVPDQDIGKWLAGGAK